jgi:branched-chain amino acid transport system substrate-binding protein
VARTDPVLSSVLWYGSDGVALSQALVSSAPAAVFAAQVGYPNPVLGRDASASPRATSVVERATAVLGAEPDAFALAAYDGLRIAVDATRAATGRKPASLRSSFARRADGYRGVSGRIVLNPAGDRAFGSYDFWSICAKSTGHAWTRTVSYLSNSPGTGAIVTRESCAAEAGGDGRGPLDRR